jgi:hypothetical protein
VIIVVVVVPYQYNTTQAPTNSPYHSVVLPIHNFASWYIIYCHRFYTSPILHTPTPHTDIFAHHLLHIDTYHAVSTAYSTVFAANSSSMPKWTSPSPLHYICLVHYGYGVYFIILSHFTISDFTYPLHSVFTPTFLSSGTSTRLYVNVNGIPFVCVTLFYSTSPCIEPDDGYLIAETCCPFWRLYGNKYTLLCWRTFCILYLILYSTPGCLLWVLSSSICLWKLE